MGLVQLFRGVPHPDLLARHLLELALEDFRETGRHYLLHLVLSRENARRRGATQELEALDDALREHLIHERIPERWHLDFLFSAAGYGAYGEGLLVFWATALVQICTLEQHWERTLLGLPPRNPNLLPGFHRDEEVWSPAWLDDFQRTWKAKLHDVYPHPGA